ncbi:MAG: hypothetical protein ACRD6X_22370, partial [Pyrinomonadaceae bacterium]
MLKIIAISLLPYLIFFGNSPSILLSGINQSTRQSNTGILEKMIVAGGSVEMDFDLSGSSPRGKSVKGAERTVLSFVAEPDSFFKVWVFNGELRGPLPSSLPIVPQNSAVLPPKLTASYQQLVLEYLPSGSDFELAIRDAKTGFVFFNIEGVNYDYDANRHLLGMNDGRLLLSPEFANELGRSKDAGSVVGRIAVQSNLRAIEVSEVVNGEVKSETLPSNGAPESGVVPGPDVIVGDLFNP